MTYDSEGERAYLTNTSLWKRTCDYFQDLRRYYKCKKFNRIIMDSYDERLVEVTDEEIIVYKGDLKTIHKKYSTKNFSTEVPEGSKAIKGQTTVYLKQR